MKKIILCLLIPAVYISAMDYFIPEKDLSRVKRLIQSGDQTIQPYVKELRSFADALITAGPWSITNTPSKAVSGNKHDYYSESPYWWPDPENPEGPYIRKDGLRNPERFMAHKADMNRMYQSVFYLSMTAYFFDQQKYADRAVYILNHWFVNQDTRMNPHLDYGQAIPNKSPGRGVGIIDTHRMAKLIEALNLLEKSGYWQKEDKKNIEEWFYSYLKWLTESENGIDEKDRGNNHSTWWAVQVLALARFVNDKSIPAEIKNYAETFLSEHQFEADGRQPKEELRTKSLDYVMFNLEAWGMLCRLAENYNQDLWNYTNTKGGSVKKALYYSYPYIKEPDTWSKEQIVPFRIKERPFLIFASNKFGDETLIALYKSQIKRRKFDMLDHGMDPFLLLMNLYAESVDLVDKK